MSNALLRSLNDHPANLRGKVFVIYALLIVANVAA
jgi:hypothetical protein